MTRSEACAAVLVDDREDVLLSVAGVTAYHVRMGAPFLRAVTDPGRREREVEKQADKVEALLDKHGPGDRTWFVGSMAETGEWTNRVLAEVKS